MNQIKFTRFPELEQRCVEPMNTLCTNLSYAGADTKTILITSRYEQEGKSFVAMNLLRSMSRLQKKVVLLDADMRCSMLDERYGLEYDGKTKNGLAQYLAGMCSMNDIIYTTNIPDAYMVPVGREVLNSLQLLHSPEMPQLMTYLRDNFDLILVDTPPAGIIVDAVALARYCDSSIIVVSYKRGKRRDIVDLQNKIVKTGCNVLGVVMNNVEFKSISSRRYDYHGERYATTYYNKVNKKKHKFLKKTKSTDTRP